MEKRCQSCGTSIDVREREYLKVDGPFGTITKTTMTCDRCWEWTFTVSGNFTATPSP
jgi:ribosomal protein L37E